MVWCGVVYFVVFVLWLSTKTVQQKGTVNSYNYSSLNRFKKTYLIHTDHVVSKVVEVFDLVELNNGAAEFTGHFLIHHVHEVQKRVYCI